MKFKLGNQSYEQQPDGSYKHLPDESDILLKAESVKRKDGTLKAKYKDLPRYKLIPTYEDYFRGEFDKMMSDLNKEVFTFIRNNI
jgi:hypothetical protein